MRLLIFTDLNGSTTTDLIETTLRLARARGDLEVCGIVTSRPNVFCRTRRDDVKRLVRAAITAAGDRDASLRTFLPRRIDLSRLRRDQGIPLVVPPNGNPNEPAFLRQLTDDVRPDVALSFFSLSIFKRPLLDVFEQAVNYHDGLLPQYRGVMATSFSIYANETETGFTFHRMTEAIDGGPVLVQGSIAIDGRSRLPETIHRKGMRAVGVLPQVLDLVAANAQGRPQRGEGKYFTRRDQLAMVLIDRPETLTAEELQRRIRAFGTLHITIAGASYPVTRLAPGSAGGPLTLRTADGALLAPDRIHGMPRNLYRLRRRASRFRRHAASRA